MRVLVTFAVDAEFAPWRLRREFVRRRLPEHYGAAACYSSPVGQTHVDVLLTGMALRNAEPGLSLLMGEGVGVCIASGLAGALRPGLACGEIVVARHLSRLRGTETRDCDHRLVSLAVEKGATAVETLLGSESVLTTSSAKREAAKQGDVVDMESFAILAKASESWIPSVAIRSISDTSEEDLPIDFNRTIGLRGGIKLGAVLSQVARHPAQLSKLVSFGRRSQEAAHKLASYLDSYIQALDGNFVVGEPALQERGLA